MDKITLRDHENKPSDEQLVLLAKEGDNSAWMSIISRYLPLVTNRTAAYVGDDFESEDLVQEGFIGFIRAVRNYRPDGGASFKTYAILCIDNSLISAVRVGLAKKRIPGSAIVPLDDCSSLPETNSAEDTYFATEELNIFKKGLSSHLSLLENKVFTLYINGCDYDKISTELDIPKKSVDNAVCRIKRKLRDLENL